VRAQRKGFTLIELLVVISIIAILAAMLFPVFARARESARKIQCLSNVKNIALAVQMYLTDYDRFPPNEHRSEVVNWFNDYGGRECCCRAPQANPYLKWPVVFDEYVKNRDVWRCPSARYVKDFAVNWGYGTGNWFAYLKDSLDSGKCRLQPCSDALPPGWGGTVTDSAAQDQCGGPATTGFDMSIGYPRTLYDMKTGQMTDPAKQVVVADAGPVVMGFDRTSWIAYPDTCRIDSVACNPNCGADWANCSWSRDCGALKGDWRWATDPQYRKDHAKARHLGGDNIGYADGHAAWMSAEQILFGGENWSGYASNPDNPLLLGVGVCINPTRAY
jgi:prepilin-type N-terminal cleavage/methylation domain-containing protein/prepilin-type processing-associated H-X9-DG protein